MLDKFIIKYYQKFRVKLYKILSRCNHVLGVPIYKQPILLLGCGQIRFGKNVQFGYYPSPFFYNTYAHIEARNSSSRIIFGNNIFINNNFSIIAEKGSVVFKDDVLIGCNVQIFDSDFHEIAPNKRNSGNHKCKNVVIGNNVFIGNNVIILKGVEIGDNSIVSAGSVVYDSCPENVIISGNPAKIAKHLNNE